MVSSVISNKCISGATLWASSSLEVIWKECRELQGPLSTHNITISRKTIAIGLTLSPSLNFFSSVNLLLHTVSLMKSCLTCQLSAFPILLIVPCICLLNEDFFAKMRRTGKLDFHHHWPKMNGSLTDPRLQIWIWTFLDFHLRNLFGQDLVVFARLGQYASEAPSVPPMELTFSCIQRHDLIRFLNDARKTPEFERVRHGWSIANLALKKLQGKSSYSMVCSDKVVSLIA